MTVLDAAVVTFDTDAWIDAIEEQRDLNAQTWLQFRNRGVADATPLELDATFVAETSQDAATLASDLRSEFGYVVTVVEPSDILVEEFGDDDADDAEPYWTVIATTAALPVTLDALDRWTDRMIEVAWRRDRVLFEGWGAMLPAQVA